MWSTTVEEPLGGRDRADEHEDGVEADEAVVENAGSGPKSELCGSLGLHAAGTVSRSPITSSQCLL
jgi:hypothetical protein